MLKRIYRWIISWPAFFRDNLAQNPILSRELIRYLREMRSFVLLACILLGGAALLSWMWSTPSNNLSPVGRRLFYATLGGEILVLLLLLPGYAAQSFISERERNTLPLLLTTPLGEERITAGKLTSVLVVIALILIATYPLIGVCLARGGVAPWEVLAAGVGVLLGAFIITSFALYFSLIAATMFRAILLTQLSLLTIYVGGMFLTFMFISASVLLVSLASMAMPAMRITFATIIFVIFLCVSIPFVILIPFGMFKLTANKLRSIGNEFIEKKGYDDEVVFQFGQERDEVPVTKPVSKWNVPEGVNAFYAREKLSNAVSSPFLAMPSWYIVAILVYHLCLITPIQNGFWLAAAVLCLLSQMAGAYSVRAFAGEKEKETWDLLITTTCRDWDLLIGKLKGALQPCLVRGASMYWIPVTLFVLIDLIITVFNFQNMPGVGVPFNHGLIHLLVISTNIVFVCALGLYFSATKPSVNRAMMWTYGAIALYFFMPHIINGITGGSEFEWLSFLSPIHILAAISSAPRDPFMLPVTIVYAPMQNILLAFIHVAAIASLTIGLLVITQKKLTQSR